MKCCCVIGGTGFIGSYVVRALLAGGRKVMVIGRKHIPTRSLPKNVDYVAGDFGDKYFLRGVLQDVDEIIDLAYGTVPKTSFENPVQDIIGNLPPAVNLFEVASGFSLDKVVIVSSGGVVYGPANFIPINEQHATNPISPYGITKLSVEKYAMMYHLSHGLPVVCVRPGNAYGESQKPFIGQGFIATVIASVITGKEISLFGENGTVRDYIHAEDIASGIVSVLINGRSGEIYNVGTGVGFSNRDVLKALIPIITADGYSLRLTTLQSRSFDVPINVLDSSKLTCETGWMPHIQLEDGLKRTWRWFVDNPGVWD